VTVQDDRRKNNQFNDFAEIDDDDPMGIERGKP
jgi:hypothetical protein